MKVLVEKSELIKSLYELKESYLKVDIDYKRKKCELLLNTDFVSVLDKSRPTVDEKKAYVDLNTLDLKEKREHISNEIRKLELELELLNDKNSLLEV